MNVKYLNSILSISLYGVTSLCAPVRDSYTLSMPTHIDLNNEGSFTVGLSDCNIDGDDIININFDSNFILTDSHGKPDIIGTINNPNIVFNKDDYSDKTINYHLNNTGVGQFSGNLNVNISLTQKQESNVLLDGNSINSILKQLNPTTITFSHDTISGDYLYDLSQAKDESILLYKNGVAVTITNMSDEPIILNTNSSHLFDSLKISRITNINYLDTSNCENMAYMFNSCSKLTTLDLSSFNTSKVKDMAYMFNEMIFLRQLKGLETFDVSNVETFDHFLNKDTKLQDIPNLTSWNISNKCNNISHMMSSIGYTAGVNGASKWPTSEVDYSNWDVCNVTDMSYAFENAFMLTALNIEGWDTSNVTNTEGMFKMVDNSDRSRLETIKGIENLNISNVSNMKDMFNTCINLNADFSNWNPINVTNLSGAFYDTRRLDLTDFDNWMDKLNFDGLIYDECFGLRAGWYVNENYRPLWYQ